MKSQMTISDIGRALPRRGTRILFLEKIDSLMPWDRWTDYIRPFYPSARKGHPVRGIELMLRMYLLGVWFDMTDENIRLFASDSLSLMRFLGIDRENECVPSATTLAKFKKILKSNGIDVKIAEEMSSVLKAHNCYIRTGKVTEPTTVKIKKAKKQK